MEVIRKQPPPRPIGNVYAIGAEGFNRFKFGFATDVDSRYRTLRTGSPVPLHIVTSVPADPQHERNIHRLLRHENTHLEWFEGPDTDRVVEELLATSAFLALPENRYVNPSVLITHLACGRLEDVFQNGVLIRRGDNVRVIHPDRSIEPERSNRRPNAKSVYRRSGRDAAISPDGDSPWRGKRPDWMDEAA